MEIIETELGFEIETQKFLAFFGKKPADLKGLENHYSNLNFLRLKQVHGCELIERKSSQESGLPEADAHWTAQPQIGLCINTADCIPVLIYNSNDHSIAAVHAGWRGVAQKIVSSAIRSEFVRGSRPQDLIVLIGPHIQKKSFEIESPVLKDLISSSSEAGAELYSVNKDGKFFFDLNSLLKLHLEELDIPSENIFNLFLDTKSDLRFHSFRRDKEKSGRQLSFISLRSFHRKDEQFFRFSKNHGFQVLPRLAGRCFS